ncbi:MAG: ABC transporter substrate-binding protein [Chloroflexi bacterium]|nr:ABC transporter substrate-binding protein [Chloroflexota bacterium]
MKSIHRLSLRALVVGGILASATVACGGEPTSAPALPTKSAASAGEQTEPEDAAVETNTDRLIFAHPADAAKLDPADITDGESLLVTWHIYEGLTRYKPGTAEVEPALATEWSTSEDGLEWTFKLREGVKFHDGSDFNADAVVWNFDRWFDPENAYHFADWDFAYWAYMFQGYKGVDENGDGEADTFFVSAEAVDPLTVKLTLSRPNAPLLQNLAMGNFGFSSPAAVEAAGDLYGTPGGEPVAVGTGPYAFGAWEVDQYILLEANADYWGTPPATPELELRVIPDGSARYLALASGEIDGMNQVNPEDIETAQGDENVQIVFEPANNVGYLGFNQANAPWGNLDCRLAVAHAIDKQAIVDTLYAGDAEVAKNMMPPGLWGYNAAVEDYPYNMDLALEYMAKCVGAETVPDEVVFYVPPVQRFYFPKPKELGEFVQASLAQLGLNARIESPDWGSVWLPAVREGKADIFLLGWGGDNGDPDNFLCQFFCGGDASFNRDAEGNGIAPSEELDALLREAATLSDQAARQAKYEEANQLVHDTLPAMPLVHRSPPLLFRANVSGYTSSPLQTILTGVSKQ